MWIFYVDTAGGSDDDNAPVQQQQLEARYLIPGKYDESYIVGRKSR